MGKAADSGFAGAIVRAVADEHHGLAHLRTGGYGDGAAIQKRLSACNSGETLLLHGVVHTAQNQLTAVLQSNAHTEYRDAVEVVDGAIDGIHNPLVPGSLRALVPLLPQDGAFRECGKRILLRHVYE